MVQAKITIQKLITAIGKKARQITHTLFARSLSPSLAFSSSFARSRFLEIKIVQKRKSVSGGMECSDDDDDGGGRDIDRRRHQVYLWLQLKSTSEINSSTNTQLYVSVQRNTLLDFFSFEIELQSSDRENTKCDMVRIITSRHNFYFKLIVWAVVVVGGGGGGDGVFFSLNERTHKHTHIIFSRTRCDEILWYVVFISKLHWHSFCFCFFFNWKYY